MTETKLKKLPKPTLKQAKFTKEYVKSGNATQAAIKAGYSKKTARQQGSENLAKPVIQAEVKSVAEKLGITTEYVLSNFKEIADFNKTKILKTTVHGSIEISKEEMIDAQAAIKSTEMLGKHLKLFTDKIELEAKIDGEIRTPEAELELARQFVAILSDPKLKQ